MNKFEMGSSPERSREFDQLNSLMGDKDHVEGISKYGAVSINRWPNGSIEVFVVGKNGVNTKFTVSEGMGVRAEAEKPARKKFSHEGGGIEEHQYLRPEFSLDGVLASFFDKQQYERADAKNMDVEDVQKDIRERAKGNPGAAEVLEQLASRGAETYSRVAPNLGTGYEIWIKYKDECGKNLDKMIKRYGG